MKTILRRLILGRAEGNFRTTDQPREVFLETLARAKEKHLPEHMHWIFGPTVKFSNRVAGLHEDNDIWTAGTEYHRRVGFVRTRSPADGGVDIGLLTGIAIFNGDCPIICLQQGDQLAVLHAGYRCLVRADPKEKNIIESAMEAGIVPFDPKRTRAWVGYGIGGCCWLPEADKEEIRNPKLYRDPALLENCLTKTTRSPAGAGHVSVDLYKLARLLLLDVGIPKGNIIVDDTCTCCAMENGEPVYWSETRHTAGKQPVNGRNFSIAWLEQEP